MQTSKPVLLISALSAFALPSAVQAAPAHGPSNGTNCWGVVSAQLAHVEGGIGGHTSIQATPRLGLGNVARLFYDMGLIDDPTVSDLGSLLASLDEYDETVCPIQSM